MKAALEIHKTDWIEGKGFQVHLTLLEINQTTKSTINL